VLQVEQGRSLSLKSQAQRHKRPACARGKQQRRGGVAVLDGDRMGVQFERSSVGIDHRVTLAAFDFPATIAAAYSATFGRFDALTVDHGRALLASWAACLRSPATR
jgi:hypothetical protein